MCRRIISVPDTCGLVISVTLFYNLMRETHLEIITEDPGVFLGFSGGSVVKNPFTNTGDTGSVSGSGRSLQKETATHSSILAQEIPWTEEPGGL